MSSGDSGTGVHPGAGMHPWGKWGRDFTEYGWWPPVPSAARRRPGLAPDPAGAAGADTIRNGYPGFVAGATFAQKLGWTGIPVSSSYAVRAWGRRRCSRRAPRSWPVCATSPW